MKTAYDLGGFQYQLFGLAALQKRQSIPIIYDITPQLMRQVITKLWNLPAITLKWHEDALFAILLQKNTAVSSSIKARP